MNERLYVIVESNLTPGLQAAQACHAAMAWQAEHGFAPENIVVLAVSRTEHVQDLFERARGCRAVLFCEPDLNNEPTAVALDSSARALVSSLPLALKDRPCACGGLPAEDAA
jgi:hypothetical protein